jgi:hypothetical protein
MSRFAMNARKRPRYRVRVLLHALGSAASQPKRQAAGYSNPEVNIESDATRTSR